MGPQRGGRTAVCVCAWVVVVATVDGFFITLGWVSGRSTPPSALDMGGSSPPQASIFLGILVSVAVRFLF